MMAAPLGAGTLYGLAARVAKLSDEYMFGPALLVAPVGGKWRFVPRAL